VLFLCGGKDSARRNTLRSYLRKRRPNLHLFYAERVWDRVATVGAESALKVEAGLADLADLVVIIVESPGTFAELGAFSLSDPLRKKLLPLIDTRYENESEPSFIATGPVRWIDSDSDFRPCIYVPLDRILEKVDEVEERIARIPKTASVKIVDLATSPKHLLFFLCDLVAVIHPATTEMIQYYLDAIAPSIFTNRISVPTLIGLADAMGLLGSKVVKVGLTEQRFYYPAEKDAIGHPFHHTRLLNLQSERATHISVLLTIPQAVNVLQELKTNHAN
jgi:hypothetical protein